MPAPSDTQPGKPLGHTKLQQLLRRMRLSATAQGLRLGFRDRAGERTAYSHDACEAVLAYIKGKTERAHQRSDLFEKRRKLMEA
jgi:hypothetical protein